MLVSSRFGTRILVFNLHTSPNFIKLERIDFYKLVLATKQFWGDSLRLFDVFKGYNLVHTAVF